MSVRRTVQWHIRGFTLLELLIAMALVGLISLLVFSGLRTLSRAWEAGGEHAEATTNAYLIQDLVRRQLRQARYVFYSGERGGRILAFEGRTDAVEFVAPMLTHLTAGGLYRLRFEVSHDETGAQLLLISRPYRPSPEHDETEEASRTTVLLEDIKNAEFAYYQPRTGGKESGWREEWRGQDRLPRLVRLRIRVEDEQWPEVVVPLSQL